MAEHANKGNQNAHKHGKALTGRIALRVSVELQEGVSEAATSENKTISQWVGDVLRAAIK